MVWLTEARGLALGVSRRKFCAEAAPATSVSATPSATGRIDMISTPVSARLMKSGNRPITEYRLPKVSGDVSNRNVRESSMLQQVRSADCSSMSWRCRSMSRFRHDSCG